MSRGQIVSYDILMAFSAFVLLFAFLSFVWNQNFITGFEQQEIIQQQILANQAAEVLIKSKGTPTDWEDDPIKMEVIGLATKQNVLSQQKLDAFEALDYETAQEALKIKQYDFLFELKTGSLVNDKTIGADISTAKDIFVLRRNVIYLGEDANVFFKLFET